jgi:hypothetical protein
MHLIKCRNFISNLFWRYWLYAITVLFIAGAFYRITESALRAVVHKPFILPIPLSDFPVKINNWEGEDIQIPPYIQQITGNDDLLYRFFVNKSSGHWVTLYLGYSTRPGSMLGHRPEICYVANGWVNESSFQSQFVTSNRRPLRCSIHRFHRRSSGYEEVVVLNFYILNGQIICDEKEFSHLRWRTPNFGDNPAMYMVQVQISSGLENSVRKAAEDMSELILDFFPDEKSMVGTSRRASITGDILNSTIAPSKE